VLPSVAMAKTETMRTGAAMIKVERYRITDAGLRERLIYLNVLSLVLPQNEVCEPIVAAHRLLSALSLCARCSQNVPWGNAWGNDERRQRSSLHVPRMWAAGNAARIRGANQRR
jgi:hypothetical protein